MATLEQGDIRTVIFQDIKVLDKVVGFWVLNLRSASDRLTVPQLDTPSGVGCPDSSVTAAFYSATSSEASIKITGGEAGDDSIVITLHKQGRINNLTFDD